VTLGNSIIVQTAERIQTSETHLGKYLSLLLLLPSVIFLYNTFKKVKFILMFTNIELSYTSSLGEHKDRITIPRNTEVLKDNVNTLILQNLKIPRDKNCPLPPFYSLSCS
jgi:hypothetical protein